jgi:hypothetical protein
MNEEVKLVAPPPQLYTAVAAQVVRQQPVVKRPKVHCHSTIKTNSCTQYVAENKPKFRVTPTCFVQVRPSSGRT